MTATPRQVILVMASDCHFCEHAHDVLAGLGVEAREVSVRIQAAHGLAERDIPLMSLPVLTDGALTIACGCVSAARLREKIAR